MPVRRAPPMAAALACCLAAAVRAAGGWAQASADPPPPLCTSCASWCAGLCAFAGPPTSDAKGLPLPNSRSRQNITIYRMTAANVTDLDSKNTGDPTGDMIFNMDERAIPIECRHATRLTPDCTEGNTHSWLLNSKLVYLQWEIEVDGRWGPYIPCNLNVTGDDVWSCPARSGEWNPPHQQPFADAELCDCNATERAVGWKDMNATSQTTRSHSHLPSAECNRSALLFCGGARLNYTGCRRCLGSHMQLLRNHSCQTYALTSTFCPEPEPASPTCKAAAERVCGQYRTASLRHNCSRCLSLEAEPLVQSGACDEDAVASLELVSAHWCPEPPNPWDNNSSATWLGWRPNHHRVAAVLGGSWFSTTAAGRCAPGASPGDASGCSWRPVGLRKAVDYSCVQSNVAAVVMKENPACFSKCTDGGQRDPADPTDCWLECFFNTMLGNTTYGLRGMTNRPFQDAWAASFSRDDPSSGGCPAVKLTDPALLPWRGTRAHAVAELDDHR